MDFGRADSPAAIGTVEINDGRFGRYDKNLAALGAPAPLTRVPVFDTDFVTTLLAAKPNHESSPSSVALSAPIPADSAVPDFFSVAQQRHRLLYEIRRLGMAFLQWTSSVRAPESGFSPGHSGIQLFFYQLRSLSEGVADFRRIFSAGLGHLGPASASAFYYGGDFPDDVTRLEALLD